MIIHLCICYSENREVALHQLQVTLANKDLEVAKLQQQQNILRTELDELRRVTKRETVNMVRVNFELFVALLA